MARYSEQDLTIDFDNFVGCLFRLENMFSKSPTELFAVTSMLAEMMMVVIVFCPSQTSLSLCKKMILEKSSWVSSR